MEIDTATATACASSALASSITTDQMAHASAAVPTVLGKVKKEITPEHRVAKSKKQAARRVTSREQAKEKKAAEERAKQAELCRPKLTPTLWPSKPPSTPWPC
jgi:hypothetical protein